MIKREIEVCGKLVPFRSSATIPRLYRAKFKRDIFKDLVSRKSNGLGRSWTSSWGPSTFPNRAIAAIPLQPMIRRIRKFPLNILQGTRDRQAVIDHLQSYELLVLEDLGMERDTSYAAEQVYSIIDVRARSRLPLIVTVNLTMEELKSSTTVQQQRIYDRISEMCPVPLKMVGNSRRSGNAAARLAAAREILGQAVQEDMDE